MEKTLCVGYAPISCQHELEWVLSSKVLSLLNGWWEALGVGVGGSPNEPSGAFDLPGIEGDTPGDSSPSSKQERLSIVMDYRLDFTFPYVVCDMLWHKSRSSHVSGTHEVLVQFMPQFMSCCLKLAKVGIAFVLCGIHSTNFKCHTHL